MIPAGRYMLRAIWTNDTFVGAIQDVATNFLTNAGASDFIISLAVDGVIGGLGAVLGFMPQMAILFLFLSILEDCEKFVTRGGRIPAPIHSFKN